VGALPKIHGELLKLGTQCRPVHGFNLHGAEAGSATSNLEDVPSQSYGGDCNRSISSWCRRIAFEQLFAFLILGHGRRQLLWIADDP